MAKTKTEPSAMEQIKQLNQKRVEAFLKEIEDVCKKHSMRLDTTKPQIVPVHWEQNNGGN